MDQVFSGPLFEQLIARQVADDEEAERQKRFLAPDPEPAQKPVSEKARRLVNVMGTQLFDAAGTNDFLRNRTASEGNPVGKALTSNPALMFGTKAAYGYLMSKLLDKLQDSGHPKIANVAETALTGFGGWLGSEGLDQTREKLGHRERVAAQNKRERDAYLHSVQGLKEQ